MGTRRPYDDEILDYDADLVWQLRWKLELTIQKVLKLQYTLAADYKVRTHDDTGRLIHFARVISSKVESAPYDPQLFDKLERFDAKLQAQRCLHCSFIPP